jgi:hypothetical protein
MKNLLTVAAVVGAVVGAALAAPSLAKPTSLSPTTAKAKKAMLLFVLAKPSLAASSLQVQLKQVSYVSFRFC